MESDLNSRGEAAGGSQRSTCRFILAKAVSDHNVRRNSGSISSVASLQDQQHTEFTHTHTI